MFFQQRNIFKILVLIIGLMFGYASALAQSVAQGSAQGAATNCRQAARGDIFSRPPFLNQEKYSLPELRKSMSGLISFENLMRAYPGLPPEIQTELLKRYHENGKNKESREFLTLYLSSLKLAHGIARKTQRIPDSFPDYFQMALIKLMESIDNFDFSHYSRFATYVDRYIFYSLLRYRYEDRVVSNRYGQEGVFVRRLLLRETPLLIEYEDRVVSSGYGQEAVFVRGLLRENPSLTETGLRAYLRKHPEYNPDRAFHWLQVFGTQEVRIDPIDLSLYERAKDAREMSVDPRDLSFYERTDDAREASVDPIDLSLYERTDESYRNWGEENDHQRLYQRVREWAIEEFSDQPKHLVILHRRIFSDTPATLWEIGVEIGESRDTVERMSIGILSSIQWRFPYIYRFID